MHGLRPALSVRNFRVRSRHVGRRPAPGLLEDHGAVFLPKCRDDFICADGPLCSHCGKGLKNHDGGEPVCEACRSRPRPFHKVRAFGVYDGSLKTALHQLKYRSRTQLAKPLGRLLFDTFLRKWPDADIDFVVPVPLTAGSSGSGDSTRPSCSSGNGLISPRGRGLPFPGG